MRKAIVLAKQSATSGDYALGAVIVRDDQIIATGVSKLKHEHDPTAHAEIVALRNACTKLNSSYLENCTLYTTHEPCPMCASAAIWAKMKGIVFGATLADAKKKHGMKFSWRQIDISCRDILTKSSPKLALVEGFMRAECVQLFELSQ